jgi:hypothetical protein
MGAPRELRLWQQCEVTRLALIDSAKKQIAASHFDPSNERDHLTILQLLNTVSDQCIADDGHEFVYTASPA